MGPMWEGVFATGKATWSEDFLYVIARQLPREEIYVTFSYSPIWDDSGAVGGIFCTCYETTGRVIGDRRLKTLRDLARMVMQAKAAEEACEVGVRTLSANPYDVPFALIYLLEGDTSHAQLVATAGLEMGSAAAPERIDLQDAAAELATWPFAAFTSELASVFRSAVEKAGLKLTVDCPPLGEPAFVDREMWEKIVLNLISNAFKFTFDGEIQVSLRQTATHFELGVRDTGVGIPADEVSKLFDRFHRVAGAQGRTHEGSGIGLALVQELARLHGGSVTVESVYGRGTMFRVLIPLGHGHLPQEQIGAARTQASTALGARPFIEEALRWLPDAGFDDDGVIVDIPTPENLERHDRERSRVLVADDNADMRDYLRRLLSSRYDVEAVADGEATLAAIARRRPDLVLADIMMPRLDGLRLAARLRGDTLPRTIPIIFLSARAGEESRIAGLDAGADDYLTKPFAARELLARVEAQLKLARLRREAEERAAGDLEAMRRLQEVGNRCARAGNNFEQNSQFDASDLASA